MTGLQKVCIWLNIALIICCLAIRSASGQERRLFNVDPALEQSIANVDSRLDRAISELQAARAELQAIRNMTYRNYDQPVQPQSTVYYQYAYVEPTMQQVKGSMLVSLDKMAAANSVRRNSNRAAKARGGLFRGFGRAVFSRASKSGNCASGQCN